MSVDINNMPPAELRRQHARIAELEAVARQALEALEDVREDCFGFPHPEYQKQASAVGALRRVLTDGTLANEGATPVALTDEGDKPALTSWRQPSGGVHGPDLR